MENIIVAGSNLLCVLPIYTSYVNSDYYTFCAILFVASASIVSHLIECHKHGMPGIGFSAKTSYIFNRLDVIGCGLVTSRLCYILIKKYGITGILNVLINNRQLMALSTGLIAVMAISEYDKYNPRLKNRYILMHSIWHLGVFFTLNIILTGFVYNK